LRSTKAAGSVFGVKPRLIVPSCAVLSASCFFVAAIVHGGCASSETTSGSEATTTGVGASAGQPPVGGSGGQGGSGGAGGSGGSGGAGGQGGSGGAVGGGGSGGQACSGPPASLDATFGTSGVQQIAMVGAPGGTMSDLDRDYGRTIAPSPGGGIVFAGEWYDGSSYNFALVRLTANGALDPSFGVGGKVTQNGFASAAPLRGVVVDGSGSVFVAGALTTFARPYGIGKLTSQGLPDTSFGGTGFVTTAVAHPQADSVTAFQPIGVQSSGKVIVGGGETTSTSDFVLARYGTNGQLDPTFGVAGTAKLAVSVGEDIITSLRVLSDDRIVVAGVGAKNSLPWEAGEFAVALFGPDGAPDTSFNGTGFATVSVYPEGGRPNGVTMQPDGKIVAIGCMSCDYNFASKVNTVVVRWETNGTLDTTFSGDGIAEISFDTLIDIGYDVVVDPAGKLVISGGLAVQQQSGKMYVARLLADGSADDCFAPGGLFATYPVIGFTGNDQASSVNLLADGSILAGGAFGYSSWGDFAVMKLVF
jgi:uncharacterized delta-60 repeat protein